MRIWFLLLAISAVFAQASVPAAAGDAVLSLSPLNPEFVKYLQDSAAGKVTQYTSEGYALGWVPPPVDLSHLAGGQISKDKAAAAPPASYDLRSTGKLTPVRDQGSCGSCWAFAGISSCRRDGTQLKRRVLAVPEP